MPTSNGRIYIDTTAEPDLGVSIDDVGSCLGRGSRDLGTLITSDAINMWAKYKPFRHSLGMSTDAQSFETLRASAGVRYGIATPTPCAPSAIISSSTWKSLYTDSSHVFAGVRTNGWDYNGITSSNIGTGVTKYAAHISDFVNQESTFVGYYHRAISPIENVQSYPSGMRGGQQDGTSGGAINDFTAVTKYSISFKPLIYDPNDASKTSDAYKVQVSITKAVGGGTDTRTVGELSVKLSDLGVGDFHFGFAMVRRNSSNVQDGWAACCTKSTLTELMTPSGQGDIPLPTATMVTSLFNENNSSYDSERLYDVYPFLINLSSTSGSIDNQNGCYQVGNIGATNFRGVGKSINGDCYPIIMFEKGEVALWNTNYDINVTAERSGSRYINVTVKVRNRTSSTISFSDFSGSNNNFEVFATLAQYGDANPRSQMVTGTRSYGRVMDVPADNQWHESLFTIDGQNASSQTDFSNAKYVCYLLGSNGVDTMIRINDTPIEPYDEES